MCTSSIWTAILAWLQLIGYLIGVIITGFLLHRTESVSGQISSIFEERYYLVLDVKIEQTVFYLIILIYCLIGLLATILLIISLSQKSTTLAVPWLCNTMIAIFVTSLIAIGSGTYPAFIIPGILAGIWTIAFFAVKSFKYDIQCNENASRIGLDTLPYTQFNNTMLI